MFQVSQGVVLASGPVPRQAGAGRSARAAPRAAPVTSLRWSPRPSPRQQAWQAQARDVPGVRTAVAPLRAKGGGKAKAPEPEPEPEAEDEVELWSVALGITKAEVKAGTLASEVCEDVRKIITKACPKLPNKKKMKALDMEDEQSLYVLTDGEPGDAFQSEESVVFAEMIFLSEDDCDVSVEAAMDALEAAGYESGVMDVDDDDEEYMEDDDEDEGEEEPHTPK